MITVVYTSTYYTRSVKHDSSAIYGMSDVMIYVQLKSLNVIAVKKYLLVNDLMLSGTNEQR